MAVNNSLVKKQEQKLTFSAYLTNDAIKSKINNIVGGKDGQRFISAIVSAVNNNSALKGCDHQSILSGALLGESLKLSPSPQLGHYYLVPFNDKEKGKVATFQLGYKGYIQLAIRSGQYLKLNVLAIKEGELEYFDPLNEEIKINLMVDNWDEREDAPTIGYYAMFELTNGFKKALYWSKKQMESHALKYSPGYRAKKGYTFWEKDFDGMAYKTMLRQLISKWGIMSVEMQSAFESDMTFEDANGTKTYVDNEEPSNVIDVEEPQIIEPEEVAEPIVEPVEPKTVTPPQDDISAALFG